MKASEKGSEKKSFGSEKGTVTTAKSSETSSETQSQSSWTILAAKPNVGSPEFLYDV